VAWLVQSPYPNLTDKTGFQGSSRDLHVAERFLRLDDKSLTYTVEDPAHPGSSLDR
jgi:hypothetical protein